MLILIAQINPTVGDIEGNLKKILTALNVGRERKADLVLFPEMTLSGYPPEDLVLLPHFIQAIEAKLEELKTHTQDIACIVGLPRFNPGKKEKGLFNSAAVFNDGKLLGFQDKQLLPTYDVFSEARYFERGKKNALFTIKGKKVAITICEDLWQHSGLLSQVDYFHDPVDDLKVLEPDFVVNLSASPYSQLRHKERYTVIKKAAKTLGCPVILCNQVGGNDSLIFDGRSACIDSQGHFLAVLKGFQEELFLLDLTKKQVVEIPFQDPREEIFKALTLGLKDYFTKLGFKKAIIGLSGGIDSAVVACIAKHALGKENILCLSMPSRYSSEGSVRDAKKLASNLGANLELVSIEPPFQAFLDLLTSSFTNPIESVTEENLQARIRGLLLMAFSNQYGHLLLSCGNKSELAMGYVTLYGDLCGGLSVLGDVAKEEVYSLARWINKDEEIIPKEILEKAPSAELKPNQRDTDTLPEYATLDKVLRDYVERHISPEEMAKTLQLPLPLVQDLVQRIHRNEFKRRQGPPVLRITPKAFSQGRRFPIVQRYV